MNKYKYACIFLGFVMGSCVNKTSASLELSNQKELTFDNRIINDTLKESNDPEGREYDYDNAHKQFEFDENTSYEKRAVSLLNQMFNTDSENKKTILVIKNDSNCDIIMQIEGEKNYRLPVSSQKAESVVVNQGNYFLSSEVCSSSYNSYKSFYDNTMVTIKTEKKENNNTSNSNDANLVSVVK